MNYCHVLVGQHSLPFGAKEAIERQLVEAGHRFSVTVHAGPMLVDAFVPSPWPGIVTRTFGAQVIAPSLMSALPAGFIVVIDWDGDSLDALDGIPAILDTGFSWVTPA